MKKNNHKSSVVLAIISMIIVSLTILAIGCVKKEEVVRVGIVLPLSGDYARLGESSRKAIEIAFEELKGQNVIEVYYEDTQGQTNLAVTATNKLISVNKVQVIIGELSSSATLAMVPIIDKNKIVLISPASSSPGLSGSSKYFFRTCASDIKEGEVMAEAAYNRFGHRNISILFINNDYGLGLKSAFKDKFEQLGGQIVSIEPFEQGSTDFRSVLIKIKAKDPDAIYMPGYAKEMGTILRQARELKINAQFLSSIDFENPQVIEIAGMAANGVIYTAYDYDVNRDRASIRTFVSDFEKMTGKLPDIYAALSYDAANIIVTAIEKENYTPGAIESYLRNQRDYQGITGNIVFDENGDVIKAITLKIYRDGEYQFL